MRDYGKQLRPAGGPKLAGEHPKVKKSFQLNVPNDWAEQREIDSNGWVDIPCKKGTDPEGERLILVKVAPSGYFIAG